MDAVRKYPLKRPPGHKPPVQRWLLRLPDGVTCVHTAYVGVQSHTQSSKLPMDLAIQKVKEWLNTGVDCTPSVVDYFRVTEGFDLAETRVWVAYWTDGNAFRSRLKDLDLAALWRALGPEKNAVGLWSETFSTPVERLETNYARLKHKPGLARIPGSEQPGHELTAYWGAGRDRLPASADDLFQKPESFPKPKFVPDGIGERLTGINYENMCHIRSGQWWERCNDEEREAYENELQETLMSGMRFLWSHPEETGTIGLRFLQNLNEDDLPIKETCAAGFHRNWADLERWSSRHPSHLAIFNGAIAHAKKFGEDREFMTWHEVSILKAGEARFEYVNCAPKTGVIRWIALESEKL